MGKEKLNVEDFIATVQGDSKEFISQLHETFMSQGCKLEIKEAKSGYVASYLLNKKTVANYVFRKMGMYIRIYANHLDDYMDFLDTLPDSMAESIQASSICKRLVNPEDCNPKCARGYDFLLQGQRLQKCRNSAFMFLICKEYNEPIKTFIENELRTCSAVAK